MTLSEVSIFLDSCFLGYILRMRPPTPLDLSNRRDQLQAETHPTEEQPVPVLYADRQRPSLRRRQSIRESGSNIVQALQPVRTAGHARTTSYQRNQNDDENTQSIPLQNLRST